MIRFFWICIVFGLLLTGCNEPKRVVTEQNAVDQAVELPIAFNDPKALLGAQLFFDVNLSKERNQSCGTCHDIANGFVDKRDGVLFGAVSLGSDMHSVGSRNTPSAAYAAFSPAFHQMSNGEYRGGQFLDGRASSLADQARGPFINPVEMALPDGAIVVERVKENVRYEALFNTLYGDGVLSHTETGFAAIADAIATFEKTTMFMPFDSKYDRALRGEIVLSPEEELGKTLFFSNQFTHCNACHQLSSSPISDQETFTNYEYRNIGIPENPVLTALDGYTKDLGLYANPLIDDVNQVGKFKVPSLRNVAVTAPYMHNGVFQDLRTVVLFYDKYNNPNRTINPETGQVWGAPEVSDNIDLKALQVGPALTDRRVDALVAFLKTLTDKRYEYLLTKE